MNYKRLLSISFALALFAIGMSGVANAQYRNDDRYERNNDPYYRNDRNQTYYGGNVRDAVRRVEDLSDDFNDRIEDALDRSRYDGTRREDRVTNVSSQFEETADQLSKRFGNGRNLNNTRDIARRLLEQGAQLDRFIASNRFDGRIESQWAQINQNLNIIANAYGFRYNGGNDGYYNPNGDYRRDDRRNDRRRGNNRRNGRNILNDILNPRY